MSYQSKTLLDYSITAVLGREPIGSERQDVGFLPSPPNCNSLRSESCRNNRSTELQPNFTPIVPTETEQLTSFSEVVKVSEPGHEAPATRESYDVAISEFLARPRLVSRYTWAVADAYNTDIATVEVMKTLLATAEVTNKTKGFAQLRARLHVRINVNGSPYHAGRIIASWAQCGGDSSSGISYSPFSNISINTASQKSTLPHVMINPAADKAYELSVPFIHSQGYYELNGSPLAYDKFRLTVLNPLKWYGGLLVDSTVSLSVYAWMTEVSLCTPIPQSELSGAVRSVVESFPRNVRGFASHFARQAADSALTSIGLGSPAILPTVEAVRPGLVPRIKADGPAYAESLASHRLVEDPVTPLGPLPDPMAFTSIAAREGFLSRIAWTDNASPAQLAYYPVHPSLYSDSGVTVTGANTGYQFLPMGFVALPFRYWRGTIRFRIEVVAPKLIRGMLRVKYLPRQYTAPSFVAETGDILTKYLDISESGELVFDVPFCASTPWLRNPMYYTPTIRDMNGILAIDIVEPLKSNGVGCEINVFCSCPDLEVSTLSSTDFDQGYLGGSVFAIPQAHVMDVFENVRDVIKVPRKAFDVEVTFSDTTYAASYHIFCAAPHYPFGGSFMSGLKLTPLSWFSSAFIASRGSIRFNIMAAYDLSKNVLKTTRIEFGEGLTDYGGLDSASTATEVRDRCGNIQHVLKEVTGDSVVSCEVPVQLPGEFRYARWDASEAIRGYDAAFLHCVSDIHDQDTPQERTVFVVYESAGDDYSLDHFQFVPTFFTGVF